MTRILSLTKKQKSTILFHDFLIAFISLPIAFLLRIPEASPSRYLANDYVTLFILSFLVKIIAIQIYKLHRGIWSFSSIIDLIQIIKSSTLAIASYNLILSVINLAAHVPR